MANKGFTILEIMIVLVIFVMLTLISMPFLIKYLRHDELKNNTREMVQILRLAQQNTVAEQVKYAVRFFPLGNTYYLVKKTSPEQIIETYFLNNVAIQEIQGFENNEAVFDSSGAVEFSGEIILNHPNITELTTIEVRPAGFISWRIYEP